MGGWSISSQLRLPGAETRLPNAWASAKCPLGPSLRGATASSSSVCLKVMWGSGWCEVWLESVLECGHSLSCCGRGDRASSIVASRVL